MLAKAVLTVGDCSSGKCASLEGLIVCRTKEPLQRKIMGRSETFLKDACFQRWRRKSQLVKFSGALGKAIPQLDKEREMLLEQDAELQTLRQEVAQLRSNTGNQRLRAEVSKALELARDSDARAAAAECTRRSEAASFEKFLAAEQQQKDTIRMQVYTLIEQQNKLQETLSKKEQDICQAAKEIELLRDQVVHMKQSQGQLIGNIGGEESNYCMSRGLIPEVFGSKETLVTSFEVLHAGTQTNSQYHLNQSVQTDDQVSALVHPETQTSNDPFKVGTATENPYSIGESLQSLKLDLHQTVDSKTEMPLEMQPAKYLLAPGPIHEEGADDTCMHLIKSSKCKTLLRIAFYSWKRTASSQKQSLAARDVELKMEALDPPKEHEKEATKQMWCFKESKPKTSVDGNARSFSKPHGSGGKVNMKKRTCEKDEKLPWKPGGRQTTKLPTYTERSDAKNQNTEVVDLERNGSIMQVVNADAAYVENASSLGNEGPLLSHSTSEATDIPDMASVEEFETAVMATMDINNINLESVSIDIRAELLRNLAVLRNIVQEYEEQGNGDTSLEDESARKRGAMERNAEDRSVWRPDDSRHGGNGPSQTKRRVYAQKIHSIVDGIKELLHNLVEISRTSNINSYFSLPPANPEFLVGEPKKEKAGVPNGEHPSQPTIDSFSGDSLDMQVRTITSGYDQSRAPKRHERDPKNAKNGIGLKGTEHKEAETACTQPITHISEACHPAEHNPIQFQGSVSAGWAAMEDNIPFDRTEALTYQKFYPHTGTGTQCSPSVNDYSRVAGTGYPSFPQWGTALPVSWNAANGSSNMLDSSHNHMQHTSMGPQPCVPPFQLFSHNTGPVPAASGLVLPAQPIAPPALNPYFVNPVAYGTATHNNQSGSFLTEESKYSETVQERKRNESIAPGVDTNCSPSCPQGIFETSDPQIEAVCGIGKILTDDLLHQVNSWTPPPPLGVSVSPVAQCQEDRGYEDFLKIQAETFNQSEHEDLSSALAMTSISKPNLNRTTDLQKISVSECFVEQPELGVHGSNMHPQQPGFSCMPCGSVSLEEFPCLERLKLAQKQYNTSVQPLVYKGGLTKEDIKNDPYGLGFMESKWSRDSSPTDDHAHNIPQKQGQQVCNQSADTLKPCDDPQPCQSPKAAREGSSNGETVKTTRNTDIITKKLTGRTEEEVRTALPDTILEDSSTIVSNAAKSGHISGRASKKTKKQTQVVPDGSEKRKSIPTGEKVKTGAPRNKCGYVELNKQRRFQGMKGKVLGSKATNRAAQKAKKNGKKVEGENEKLRQPHMQRILTTVHQPIAYGKGQAASKITISQKVCSKSIHDCENPATGVHYNGVRKKQVIKTSHDKQKKASNQSKTSGDASRNSGRMGRKGEEPPYQVPIATYVAGKTTMVPKQWEPLQNSSSQCPAFVVGAQPNPGFKSPPSPSPQPLPGRVYQHPMYIPFVDKTQENAGGETASNGVIPQDLDGLPASMLNPYVRSSKRTSSALDPGNVIMNTAGNKSVQEVHVGQENVFKGDGIKEIGHRDVGELPFREVQSFDQSGFPMVLKFELLKKFGDKTVI